MYKETDTQHTRHYHNSWTSSWSRDCSGR